MRFNTGACRVDDCLTSIGEEDRGGWIVRKTKTETIEYSPPLRKQALGFWDRRPAIKADDVRNYTVPLASIFSFAVKKCPSIAIDSEVVAGAPCIKGTRIPVYIILEILAEYGTMGSVIEEYPDSLRSRLRALSSSQNLLWSVLLSTKKLKLLFDQCVQGALAREISAYSGIHDTKHIGCGELKGMSGTLDPDVIRYANSVGRIVVTVETRMDEKTFPICTHPGIIVLLAHNNTEKAVLFKKLLSSGKRKECDHAVTKLNPNNPHILRRINGKIVTIPLDLKGKSHAKRRKKSK